MSKRLQLFKWMNVVPKGVYLVEARVSHWWDTVELHCLYDPEVEQPFTVVLQECTQVTMTSIDPDEVEIDPIPHVIGFHWDDEAVHKRVVIFTPIIELVVVCNEMSFSMG